MATIPIPQQNVAGQAYSRAQQIVGQLGSVASSAVSTVLPSFSSSSSLGSSAPVVGLFSPQGGNVILSSIYYILIFLFILFVILIIVNQTVTPVFSLAPGQPGIISLPGATDDEIYWTSSYPNAGDYRPRALDKLVGIDLKTNYSMSIDCYLPALSGIPMYKRVLFFKGARGLNNSTSGTAALWAGYPASNETRPVITALQEHLNTKDVSMVGYINEENKLFIDFSSSGTPRFVTTLGPIDNIPMNEPFRVTITVEEKLIDFYLNGRLVQSRALATALTSPVTGKEAIYPTPQEWRLSQGPVTTSKCAGGASSGIGIKILNLHLWPRAISAPEVAAISPQLASVSKWDALSKTDTTIPQKTETSGSGSMDSAVCASAPASGNPLKDLDTKSVILIIAGLASAVYLFRNNQPANV